MTETSRNSRSANLEFLLVSALAVLCAAGLMFADPTQQYPVLGDASPLPVILICAALGWFSLRVVRRRGIGPTKPVRLQTRHGVWLVVIGAALAVPPIAIDLALPLPADMNVALPWALLFYPAIALVAEVVLHLLPLAILAFLAPAHLKSGYLLVPVIFVEPVFQVMFAGGVTLQSFLVFCNVSLISATGLWLFLRYGFAAMVGLRIAFYLFWHILWGTARLGLLF